MTGHSGQPVHGIEKACCVKSSVEALKHTLNWRHMCPTAPDITACYPFNEEDPFILEECPHVYFAGNCSRFGTEMVEGPDGQQTRVISIPSFATTGTAVMVNLASLECHPMNFSCPTMPAE